jgi:hypothetical protein
MGLLKQKSLTPASRSRNLVALKPSLKRVGNKFQKLVQQIQKLDKESVEIGHFKESGVHSSGFTYAELMAIHHNGGNPTGSVPLPPRPVLTILHARNLKLTDPAFKHAFNSWVQRKPSDTSDNLLLEEIGRILRDKEKKIFGSSDLTPNAVPPKTSNRPLIETGELRSKVAYKTSKNKQVKEG